MARLAGLDRRRCPGGGDRRRRLGLRVPDDGWGSGAGDRAGRGACDSSLMSSATMSARAPVRVWASRARRQPRDTTQGHSLYVAMRQGMSASSVGQYRG
ncbi:hypothetical protein ACWCPI_37645 [Streptomyces sp. NPDC001920]